MNGFESLVGGASWVRYSIVNSRVNTSDVRDSDDVFAIPVGAGLATYVGDRRRITRADVEKLVVSAKKYSVWQFAEMLASKSRSRIDPRPLSIFCRIRCSQSVPSRQGMHHPQLSC